MDCDLAYCSKCKGVKHAVLGALILLNAFYWPMWLGLDGWLKFFGALFLLGGLLRAVKPSCGCPGTCPTPAVGKKKK